MLLLVEDELYKWSELVLDGADFEPVVSGTAEQETQFHIGVVVIAAFEDARERNDRASAD